MVVFHWLERGVLQIVAPDKNYRPPPIEDTSFFDMLAPRMTTAAGHNSDHLLSETESSSESSDDEGSDESPVRGWTNELATIDNNIEAISDSERRPAVQQQA